MGLTNGLKATSGSASIDTVISTGLKATVGSAYTLDGVGNRTNTDLAEPLIPGFENGTRNYTYNTGNILATAAGGGSLANGVSYTHDVNGNRTQKVAGAVTVDYTYDPLNRLTQVTDGTNTTQYIYNGLGQRVGKIEDGIQTNYLIDPNGVLPQVLAEMDASNNLIAFYVYDGAGLVAKITSASEYYFYHYDGLGSTVAITDSTAQIVNAYAYSPYGLLGAQETISNPFTYVGRFGVMAEGHGLYYMRARYYDPEVGRFINKDPIGYAGGINLFGYCINNPTNNIDAKGLHEQFYNGYCRYISGGPLPGLGVIRCMIWTNCRPDNTYEEGELVAVFGGLTGAVLPAGVTYFNIKQSVSLHYTINEMVGSASIKTISGAIGPLGRSYTVLKLGNTEDKYFDWQAGFDASIDVFWGWSWLEGEVEIGHCFYKNPVCD